MGKRRLRKKKGSIKDEKGGPPIVYTNDIHPMPQAKILISFHFSFFRPKLPKKYSKKLEIACIVF